MTSLTAGPVKVVSPGIFEIGKVRLDKLQRTVAFPAMLNTNQGPMEYFLVTDYGKRHESVLYTDTEPYQIHAAMLLLDAKAGTGQLAAAPQANIANPGKDNLGGDKISITISWQAQGKEVRRTAEELVFNTEKKAVLSRDAWVYNGSALWQGHFLAQQDGSIVSLITDPSALINSTGLGHDNDHIWTVNTNSLPPANTPLQVTISLASQRPKK